MYILEDFHELANCWKVFFSRETNDYQPMVFLTSSCPWQPKCAGTLPTISRSLSQANPVSLNTVGSRLDQALFERSLSLKRWSHRCFQREKLWNRVHLEKKSNFPTFELSLQSVEPKYNLPVWRNRQTPQHKADGFVARRGAFVFSQRNCP